MPVVLLLLALLLVGCPLPATSTDASVDRADKPAVDAPSLDALVVTDLGRDVRDAGDAPRFDAPDTFDAPVVDVAPFDAGDAGCTPGSTLPCTCITGRAGTRTCHTTRVMGFCTCITGPDDGGVAAPLPPRLVFPLSDTRVTSRRPTLRWVLPDGITRARVELCADRACTRSLVREEVSGTSWRSATPLATGVVFWHVQGLDAAGAVAWSSATWEFLVRHRDTEVDSAYGTLHDFNNDGFDDVVAGSSQFTWTGMYVYLGAPRGIEDAAASVLNSPEADAGVPSNPFSDQAVGDFNGDGLSDFAASEENSPAFDVSLNGGHAHVFWGGGLGLEVSRNQTLSLSREPDLMRATGFGVRLAGVDFDGDGFADLLVGREPTDWIHPELFLFRGGADGVSSLPVSSVGAPGWYLANGRISGVGDIDRDGYGDFACGVPNGGSGTGVVILYGNPSGRLGARIEELPTPELLYDFGRRVVGTDANGDGFADVFVASLGQLSVLYGTNQGLESAPDWIRPPHGAGMNTEGVFGSTLGVQGDLNGDGYVDLTIAGECNRSYQRAGFWCTYPVTYLFASSRSGVAATPSRFFVTTDESVNTGFDHPVSPGDMDGDGIDDLVIGMSLNRSLYFYHGGDWGWSEPTIIVRGASWLGRGVY